MAEALAGLAVACNIIDIVKTGQEAAIICRQIYRDGQDVQTSTLKETTEALQAAITEWRTPPASMRTRNLATTSKACFNVASELKQELDGISITGKKSLSKVVGTTLKSMKKAGHIQKLKGQLKEYEDVMNTQILVQLSKQISELEFKHDQVLSDHVTHLQGLLQQLRRSDQSVVASVKNLRAEIVQRIEAEHVLTRDHIDKAVQNQKASLEKSNAQEHTQTRDHTSQVITSKLDSFKVSLDEAARHQKLLDSLVVPEMLRRQGSSKIEPYKDTCEWILKPGAANEKGWDDFIDWLEHGHATYWVSGKPGSGKSTLMSFLVHDGKDRIVGHLRSWSGTSECHVLSAFFFEGGTELQRNSLGFLRNLLWQLLKEDHKRGGPLCAIVDGVSPESVESVWTEKQLMSSLIAAFTGTKDTICLILDGLDEFDDKFLLLRILASFEKLPNVKMCVSSRPEVVLVNAIGHNPQLQLQDLTQAAIEKVIDEDLIKQLPLDAEFSKDLKTRLTQRARGVFLWVDLVIKDLRYGYSSGDSFEDLLRRLDNLPSGLYDLYTNMLKRNNQGLDQYKIDAERYLSLIHAGSPLTVLQVKIALDESLQDSFLLPESTWDYAEICRVDYERLATQIRARCSGLLEVQQTPSREISSRPFLASQAHSLGYTFKPRSTEAMNTAAKLQAASGQSVQFVHRTVIEYLNTSDEGKAIIGSDPAQYQNYLTNANRARLVSAIALSDVECVVKTSSHLTSTLFRNWLQRLREDYSTLSLALLAFNRMILKHEYRFQRTWKLGTSPYGDDWWFIPGDSQYGINYLFWFPHFIIKWEAVGGFLKLHGQALNEHGRIYYQLLLALSSSSRLSRPMEDLCEWLLTGCSELDTPYYGHFSPRRTVSLREFLFLRAVYLNESKAAMRVNVQPKLDLGLSGPVPIEPNFTEVCQRGKLLKVHFGYNLSLDTIRIHTIRDLFSTNNFRFSLLWDGLEKSWYDVSGVDTSDVIRTLHEDCLNSEYEWKGKFATMSSQSIFQDNDDGHFEHICQILKASGRRLHCAQQIVQILDWPRPTPDELVDLEEVLFSEESVPHQDIPPLLERMAFRLQGLRFDPLVSVPEFTEWFVQTYAPEKYKPAPRKN